MSISPGAYSKIIPLESYVQEIPGSTAFIAALTPKGPDNKLTYIASLEQFDKLFGKPSLSRFGKYAHGHYVARSFIGISPSMYFIRPLPADAKFANKLAILFIENPDSYDADNNPVYLTNPVKIIWTSDNNVSSVSEVESLSFNVLVRPDIYVKDTAGNVYKLEVGTDLGTGTFSAIFTPVSGVDPNEVRDYVIALNEDTGAYEAFNADGPVAGITAFAKDTEVLKDGVIYRLTYNAIDGFKFDTNLSQAQYSTIENLYAFVGKYRGEWYNNLAVSIEVYENRTDYIILNIYEKVENDVVITNQYNISFNPEAIDDAYNSIYIKEILDRYNYDLGIAIKEDDYQFVTTMTKGILVSSGHVISVDRIIRNVDELATLPTGNYFIADRAGGWINSYAGSVLEGLDPTTQTFTNQVLVGYGELVYDTSSDELFIHAGNGVLYEYDPYLYAILKDPVFVEPVFLLNGSDGSLLTAYGTVNTDIAEQLIAQAYVGEIDPDVRNTEFYWFDLVLDGGYSRNIKGQIVRLASEIRRDCVAILDNGDNTSANEAIQRRLEENYFNTEYAALYEPYIKIYDTITGKNIWITPVYSVAKLIALNDKINEVWYAVAGFQRGIDSEIIDIRYTPELGERDQFYLNQINPFVKFREGTVLWGQLTTRRKSDPLQDLNIVRLILYVDRALKQFARYELFEFNDTETRNRIESAIKRFLQDVQNKRGLYEYSVKVYATEYQIQNKSATADIILYPTRTLERIYLNFFIK